MNDGYDKATALTDIVNQYFDGDDNAFKAWSAKQNDALGGKAPAQVLVEDQNFGHYHIRTVLATQKNKLAPII